MTSHAEVEGTLQPDGTLVLDQKVELPAGRVKVLIRPIQGPGEEGWWPFLQRMRAEFEARGHHFMNEEELTAWINWLREEDDRIERVYQEIEEAKRRESQG